ncbi:MAG TPA: lysine transporter LysE [Stellaceae bacterium]|nr:lysine transporter LysE [Stellaceae bacterium]
MTSFPLFLAAAALILSAPGPTNFVLFAGGAGALLKDAVRFVFAALAAYLFAIGALRLLGAPVAAAVPSAGVALRAALLAYLLLLAWRLWRTPAPLRGPASRVGPRQVFIATLLNPKTVVLAFAVFPSPAGDWRLEAGRFGALAVLVCLSGGVWTAAGALASRRDASARLVPRAAALALVLAAALIGGAAMAGGR